MTDPGMALLVFAVLAAGAGAVLWLQQRVWPALRRRSGRFEQVRLEDALKHIFMCRRDGQICSLESLAGRLEISTARAAALLSRLARMDLVLMGEDGPALTAAGEQAALRIVRTHRLWERYLADRTGIPSVEWHDHAERMEHALSPEETEALAVRLGHPPFDPHGDPIPTSMGEIPPRRGIGLLAASAGRDVEIVHLEDEPAAVYDTLVANGLTVGGRLRVVDRDDHGVTVLEGGRQRTLDPVAARNVTVSYLADGERPEPAGRTLADAGLQQTVRVRRISQACQGAQRRRLLDLGVVRGAEITPEMASVTGDPVAYRIRGALIALRREQATWIELESDIDRTREVA